MELEPELRYGVDLLKRAGWRVVVVSNGCRWYIDCLLAGDVPRWAAPLAWPGSERDRD